VFAAGTFSAGTIRGMIAPRVAEVMAKPIACTAMAARITWTLPSPAHAWKSTTSVEIQVMTAPTMSSLRRSITSATAPPHRPKMMSGMRLAGPSRPTHSDDFVMS